MKPIRGTLRRFWTGREMPKEYVDFGRKWISVGGFLTVNDIIDEMPMDHDTIPSDVLDVIDDIVKRDGGRNGIEMAVQIADIVGYLCVWGYGGTYMNCDIEPVRRFIPPTQAWASYENEEDWRIVNAAIGAPAANDPFWAGLLEALPARYFANPTAEMVETTGPALLTDYARAHPDLITVLPKNTFSYVHWREVALGEGAVFEPEELPEEVVGIHHWGHKRDGRTNTVENATQG